MTVVVIVVALVVVIATYLTWLASRLDRLAGRVDAARTGLVAQLMARADAARALALRCDLAELAAAADRARAGHAALLAGAGLDTAAEDAENALSRALRASAVAAAGQTAAVDLHAVDSAAARVALARQFHNDAVGDVRSLAGRRLVRVLHLSGRRTLPSYFEIDDTLPGRDDQMREDQTRDGDPAGPPQDVARLLDAALDGAFDEPAAPGPGGRDPDPLDTRPRGGDLPEAADTA